MKTNLPIITAFLFILCGLNRIASAQTDFLWAKQLAATNYAQGSSVVVDASGNVYTTGNFEGTIDMDPGAGVTNFSTSGEYDEATYISKLDASGNFLWAKQFSGSYNEGDFIALDEAGNIYIGGSFGDVTDFDPGSGVFNLTPAASMWGGYSTDMFITKLDPSGNFLWAKQIGGEMYDYLTGMAVDPSGDIYFTGALADVIDFDPGAGVYNLTSLGGMWDNDVFVCKLDNSGSFVWAKQIGGVDYQDPGGLALDAVGNIYITGGYSGTTDFDPGAGIDTITATLSEYGYSSEDIYICKLTDAGDLSWVKSMGGTDYERGSVITTYPNGDIYSAGTFSAPVDFDPGPGNFTLTPTGGGSYTTNSYISKLHPLGVFAWVVQFTGEYNQITAIAVDGLRNVYTAGSFEGAADFDPGAQVHSFTATGGGYDDDCFISKLDGAGFYVSASKFGGNGYDQAFDITFDNTGGVYATGSFSDTVDFDPGEAVFNLSVSEEYVNNPFILKLHSSNVGIDEQTTNNNTAEFGTYPNPTNGQFNLKVNLTSDDKLIIDIVDIQGQVLKTLNQQKMTAGVNTIAIDASELSSGIYFVKAYNKMINNTMKIVISK